MDSSEKNNTQEEEWINFWYMGILMSMSLQEYKNLTDGWVRENEMFPV